MDPKDDMRAASVSTPPLGVILLVEDEPAVREASEALLQSEGYSVICAADGREALTILRAGLRPCIIILDLLMPVMDGWRFRREQLRDSELLKIPTIVYSAAGEIDHAVEELNVAGGFEKGDFDEMLRFVAQFCPGTPPLADFG